MAAPPQSVSVPGEKLWASRYEGGGNGNAGAEAIGVSPDGQTVFVTGWSSRSPEDDDHYATVAYDAGTGSILWAKRFDGGPDRADRARALAVSPDGARVIVTGDSWRDNTFLDYATVAYDAATGSRLWTKRYDGGKRDYARSVAVSPDASSVFVTGISYEWTNHSDIATVAYDASSGSELWVMRYLGHDNDDDYGQDLDVSPDGSTIFVTGGASGPGPDEDYATVAYDASTGAMLWARRYNGPGNALDSASDVRVSPDGSRVFVAGSSRGHYKLTKVDYATVAYDASTGSRLWVRRFDGPVNGNEFAEALTVSPDGSAVFITGGTTGSSGSSDYATVAYDATTGSRLWVRRYDGPAGGDDSGNAVGVSPDGSTVFVTGESAGSTGSEDYATVAYDSATGSRLWVRRYDGPAGGDDFGKALGVSPDGSTVFVTGSSVGSTGSFDSATVAYEAT